MTPYSHHIRAECSGSDTTASRCVALIERGIQKLALTQRVGALQKLEFRAMCKAARTRTPEKKTHRWGPGRRMTDKIKSEMRMMRRLGISPTKIAEVHDCSMTTVFRITGKAKGPLL